MKKNIIYISIAIASMLTACQDTGSNQEKEHSQETHQKDIVSMSMQQMKAINLQLGKIEKHNLSTTVKSNGRVELLPQNKANVSPLMGGIVRNLYVIEGEFVKKGKILATLEHPDFIDMQQQYLETVNQLEYLRQEYLRKKKLYEEQVGSGKDYQKALAEYKTSNATAIGLRAKLKMLGIRIPALEAGNIYSKINIISPISGYIRFVKVNIGTHVEPNDEMFEIVGNDNTHADLLVYEKDIQKIKENQEVHFSFPNMPGIELKGKIFSVGRAYENEAHAITIHASIEENNQKLIPGMYLNAHIMVDSLTSNALPEDAIATEGDKHFIFVKTKEKVKSGSNTDSTHQSEEKWYFRKTEIIPGVSENGIVEVKTLKPLAADADIAVNAAYYLLAEMGKGETEHSH